VLNLWYHLLYFFSDFREYLTLSAVAFAVFVFVLYFAFRSSLSTPKKQFIVSFVFLIFTFVFVYSGFEAYFRYRFDESDSLGFLNVTKKWNERHVEYNNFQYRDNKNYEITKTKGVVRIGVMGDSNTFGYGIKDVNNRFSNVLEKKLNDSGYKAEVYNCGVSGLDTWNEIIEYKTKCYALKPDILVWQYFLNDIQATKSAGTTVLQNAGSQINPTVKFISDHSFFFNYTYWRLSTKYSNTFYQIRDADLKQYKNPEVFAFHTSQINEFSSYLKSENIKFVVTVFPFFKFFPDYPAEDVHKRMDKIFQENGATAVVDMLSFLKGRNAKDLIVGQYDTHPNEYVHGLVADKLYEAIVPLLEKTKEQGTILKNNE
jgi:hypothetical protein